MNYTNTELIDRYLSKDMTSSEAKLFESQVSSDISLQKEFNQTFFVVEAIKKKRIELMKSSLSNMNISLANLFWKSVFKVAYMVFGSLLIGSLIYYFKPSNKAKVELTKANRVEVINNEALALEKSIQIEKSLDNSKNQISVSSESKLAKAISLEKSKTTKPKKFIESSFLKRKIIEPIVLNTEDNNQDNAVTLPNVSISESKVIPRANVEIKSESAIERNKKHFKYTENKLSLYGNFSKSPYELIELKKNGLKTIYLYHEGQMYSIAPSTEIVEMVAITDQSTIEEISELLVK